MNSINITGRLTRDPELRITTSGIDVCSFSLAVERPGVKDKADFFDIVAWRGTAELVNKYFRKGDGIEVSGYLTTRDWTDKNGNNRKAVEIVAERVFFPKDKKSRGIEEGGYNAPYSSPVADFEEVDEDGSDLPF